MEFHVNYGGGYCELRCHKEGNFYVVQWWHLNPNDFEQKGMGSEYVLDPMKPEKIVRTWDEMMKIVETELKPR